MSEVVKVAAGVVRFFDVSRGYGIVDRRDGGADIFIHASVVEAFNGKIAIKPGAKIVVVPEESEKGWRAAELIDLDEDDAAKDDPDIESLVSGWVLANVKAYDRARGFGFLTLKSGVDVFLHNECLQRCGVRIDTDGPFRSEQMEVKYALGEKGPYAVHVRRPVS